MSPLDNWTDEEDDDDDYDIHSTYSESIISSPGVVISCAMALAAAAMAWLSNDMHIIVGTGATVLATGGAVAALSAVRSGSIMDEDLLMDSIHDNSSMEEDPSYQWSPNNLRSVATNAQDTIKTTHDYAVHSESASNVRSNNLAQQWQQNQAVDRLNTNTEFAPLEIDDSSARDREEAVYDTAYDTPLTPATASALYSSARAAQLDAAPVPLTTKIERLKVELELAREWQEANMAIKPAPPPHNGYKPVADPLNDLKPPSVSSNGPPKFPDPPIMSSPTFPAGGKSTASFSELADKLKTELDLARDFFVVE
eukprot:CAMPEP_0202500450 /NCGR_PEP_ID=MMETSP1361-20130828/33169_1 /ASSEMBLY_ACC=CAM_ASM_000849 /TAXON_ID=210615 /ORGANISM="Staurosira complex sp., Strain CCMP2646" /LENGTH=310 /DNA_ID=CAMNT_0049132909 /DNA_START=24 /DNA_END=956 /DNA_ORIENTATION=-